MRLLCLTLLGFLGCAACGGAAEPERAAQARERFQVLVFTKTTGFRHDSIPDGVKAIQQLGRERGFGVDATSDAGRFTSLGRYEAVVFLSTTGTPIARAGQQRAFERYIRDGGGFVGVHAASDTRGRWPWYERLVGARFKRHDPGVTRRTVRLEDLRTAATRGLPATWERVRRVVRVPLGPARPGPCPGVAGRIASARLVPRLRWRPFRVHGDGTYARVILGGPLPRAPLRGDRDGGRPREVRLCAVSGSRC